jgi:hypothetical protein
MVLLVLAYYLMKLAIANLLVLYDNQNHEPILLSFNNFRQKVSTKWINVQC